MRTVIIDDESHVRETIRALLTKHCPDVKVVGEGDGVSSGINIIRRKKPDLVLLDIKMDDGTGFDMLDHFGTIDFKIIFITAYNKFALEAFQFSAVDYLLKPVNPQKLSEAVKKVKERMQIEINKQLFALRENLSPGDTPNRKIVLKTLNNIHLVNSRDIIQCRADDCYTIVECITGEKIMVSRILKEFDLMLSDHGFLRIHRTHLVNLHHIKSFLKQEGGYVVMINDEKIPVASGSRDKLLRLFDEMEKE